MEWYVKLPLVVLGLAELVIRAFVALVLCVFVVGLVLFLESEESMTELLTPWCFKHIQECERQQRRSDTPLLSRRQRSALEYMRQEQLILEQRKSTLAEINRLESGIGAAFHQLP